MGFKFYRLALENYLNSISIFIYEAFTLGKFRWFWNIKDCLWTYYFLNSPYRIVSRVHKNLPASYDNLIYGETPFITMKHILEKEAKENLNFCDIGAGRGTAVFLAGCFFKMRSVGFEIIPDYVNIANKIKTRLKLKNIEFINGDFFEFDLSRFDIIYIPSATWDKDAMEKIEKKLKSAKQGSSIISVATALKYNYLKKKKESVYPFSWGISTVYFYEKIDSHM